MALTPSNMLPLGTTAPDFNLPDVTTGDNMTLADFKSEKATVVMFICNHCPYVIHLNHEIVSIANQYEAKGVKFVAISSNDVTNYPQDSPDKMKIVAKVLKYPFPYLYDESQDVAKAYDAACTPDFYVFNNELKLVYRGRLDNSSPGNGEPVTGSDMRKALDSVLANQYDIAPQMASIGCNIKWK